MTNDNGWINTPGLKTILEEDVPLAGKLLREGRYPILVRGAQRTGKSHIRNKVYEASGLEKLHEGVINCAAIPENLAESLLFGHKKGSFTGATEDKFGLLSYKSDPPKVVFLEEIGELSQHVQAKLLVFFDTGFFMPVGEDWGEGKESNIRVIATSNAADEKFRPDFLSRFWEIKVPPLHERREDIPYFLNLFLDGEEKKLSNEEIFYLMTHNWPNGVTEIQKVCIKIQHQFQTIENSGQFDFEKYFWRLDFVKNLIIGKPHYFNEYSYFCMDILYEKNNNSIEKLFPRLCVNKGNEMLLTNYGKDDLIQEWKTWCEFFNQDEKSPSNIAENFTKNINNFQHKGLLDPFLYFDYFYSKNQNLGKDGKDKLRNLIEYTEEYFITREAKEDRQNYQQFSLEETSPEEYKKLFWEYQAKNGRTGSDVNRRYGINKKTAETNIRNAKRRLAPMD